jgi:hypothetical protein
MGIELGNHLAICELIIENTKDKNPEDYSGTIPLYLAAFEQKIQISNYRMKILSKCNVETEILLF